MVNIKKLNHYLHFNWKTKIFHTVNRIYNKKFFSLKSVKVIKNVILNEKRDINHKCIYQIKLVFFEIWWCNALCSIDYKYARASCHFISSRYIQLLKVRTPFALTFWLERNLCHILTVFSCNNLFPLLTHNPIKTHKANRWPYESLILCVLSTIMLSYELS